MRTSSTLLVGSLLAFSFAACGGGSDTGTQSASPGAGGSGTSSAANGPGATSANAGTTSGPGAGTTTSSGTTSGPGSTGGAGSGGGGACIVDDLLSSLGKTHVLVGATMEDDIAKSAPFDLRYQYLSGGIFSGTTPCASCAMSCNAGGQSCANSNPNGCAWWGCWQYDQDPPGAFLRSFITTAQGDQQIPMVSYYQILQASGVQEGSQEVTKAANDPVFMERYYADWRFLCQQVGDAVAFLQIEPDFWGYAGQVNLDPTKTAAAVTSANPTDCANEQNTIAGMGHCLIAMTRKYAPKAKVGLHASAWGTNMDVLGNSDPNFDVAGEAKKLGAFMVACGADQGDFMTVDASDRDAGYYQSVGKNTWWDATNATLPNFHQAFAWAKALGDSVGKPIVWWQVPVGNMSLPNKPNAWKDNRVDYFFAHMDEVAAANGAAVAYGAGDGNQTTPSTDGGNLLAKTKAYSASGGQKACP